MKKENKFLFLCNLFYGQNDAALRKIDLEYTKDSAAAAGGFYEQTH